MINRAHKSEWTVQKLRVNRQFESLEGVKRQVSDNLKEAVEDPICRIGYIEAGHVTRGKQRWLTTDEDLVDMYDHYSWGEILLGLIHLRTQVQVLPLSLLVRSVHILRADQVLSVLPLKHPERLSLSFTRKR